MVKEVLHHFSSREDKNMLNLAIHRVLRLTLFVFFLFASHVSAIQPSSSPTDSPETTLYVVEKNIKVNGREATIYAITQKDGTLGLKAKKGQQFNVRLENQLSLPTSVHWHGLILPNDQDGVAYITQFPIYPGQSYKYQFPIVQAGTFWMHSHVGLQEQRLLTAPLILEDIENSTFKDQEVVILLSDFSFIPSQIIFQELKTRNVNRPMVAMDKMGADIVDVNYDAFLANHKTLESPEQIQVQPGKKVRLRIINGSSATNFLISLGSLKGAAIAVDGNEIAPFEDSQFDLGVAQRIDVLIAIPEQGGAFPILAQGEGTDMQTGIILSTDETNPPKLTSKASQKIGRLSNSQESKLIALFPLPKKAIDNHIEIKLGGNMKTYDWTLNGQMWPEVTPPVVEKGQRVEIAFINETSMTHPMHLHGHVFQVTEIDGKTFEGAMRDTVLVMPKSTVKIQFDADNPGVWPLHCHVLYHMEAGMFTVLRYKDFIQPLTQ